MTIKLFETDAYLKEVECNIVEIVNSNEDIMLILDKTLFFPEKGGQPCDLGTIGDCNVLEVFEKNCVIYHKVDKIPVGKNVMCILDWERRFDHMQQHCGEHILSGVFLKYYDYHNVGFHLGKDCVTIDIDVNEISEDIIRNMENKANEEIYNNRNISITTVDSEDEVKTFSLRKMPDIDDNIRVVQINEVDCVACCGTHPLKTGEVGLIKIIKTNKYKGMTRIYFKCGKRAFEEYQLEHDLISLLNRKYSSELSTLLEKIETGNVKSIELKNSYNKLIKNLSIFKANNLINKSNNKIISNIYEDEKIEELDLISNHVLEKGKYITILCSLNDKKLMATTNDQVELNFGKVFKTYIAGYEGRGGGSSTKAQGSFADKENMLKFYYFFIELINNSI